MNKTSKKMVNSENKIFKKFISSGLNLNLILNLRIVSLSTEPIGFFILENLLMSV